jgi:glycerol kinase
MFESAEQIELLAASVTDNGGVFFVPALAGLGAPHWDPYARGSVFGLTRGTQKGHLARAALEGIAFQVADVLQAMQADADMQLGELRVDGGVAANNLLLQFQADLLNVPVVRSRVLETTALGAAYLAGLAVGIWRDPKELALHARDGDSFAPKMTAAEAESLQHGWQKALTRSRSWVEAEEA